MSFKFFSVLFLVLSVDTANSAKCGRPAIQPITTGMKIVGGINARPNSWPWQVLLEITTERGVGKCGGSLINNHERDLFFLWSRPKNKNSTLKNLVYNCHMYKLFFNLNIIFNF